MGAIPVLFAQERDYKDRIKQNEIFRHWFTAVERDFGRFDFATLPDEAFAVRYRELLFDHYYRTESSYFHTIFNTSQSKLDFKAAFDKAHTKGAQLNYLHLIGGLQDLKHLNPLNDLWELATTIQGNPVWLATVSSTPVAILLQTLLSNETCLPLAQAIDAFLQRYGYHSVKELDITVPHWREDPSFVLRTLQGYVKAGSEPKHPAAASQAQYARYQEERAKAESFFKGRLGRKGFFTKLVLAVV